VLSSQDYSTVYGVLDETETHLRSLKLQYLSDEKAAEINSFTQQIAQKKPGINFSYDPQNIIPNALRFYYHWQNDSDSKGAAVVSVLTMVSYFLMFAPAIDLFIRVFQTTTGTRLPVF
jgi:hypothetical protein